MSVQTLLSFFLLPLSLPSLSPVASLSTLARAMAAAVADDVGASVAVVEPEPEERPKVGGAAAAHGEAAEEEVVFPMAWTDDDELCPEGTVPVRQTTKRDVLRSSSSPCLGMKQPRAGVPLVSSA
uniref:Neprosin activation peptide domain-containing protein n=2 Tax=Oryza sativa subsp. japonica TaxID=39947 RepID=Q53NN1_ORYSJ|nr:putative protein-related [Oryza sativa Japonica Group]ABA95498.1 hypothetical protein LOC_Os11g47740 [Oryza sativa Japonica Group]